MRESSVLKRSVMIGTKRTSVSLENEFWNEVRMIAGERAIPINRLLLEIEKERTHQINLSSAIRLYILEHAKKRAVSMNGARSADDQSFNPTSTHRAGGR